MKPPQLPMRQMHLVHLLLHMVEIQIPHLRRVLAVFGVGHFGPRPAAREGSVNLKTQQFVEALRPRRELA
jgi:hypothetical protein